MWRNDAACLDAEPALFDNADVGMTPRAALAWCVECPVRRHCLDEALTRPGYEDIGVWGGTTLLNRHEVRMGRLTPAEAMARGDQVAAGHVDPAETEPWIADVLTGVPA